ncbi:ClpP/crotonase-like domain-containing protein [Aspergillus floccosus]
MAKNAEAIITTFTRRLNGQVATITISRPSKLNSLNTTLLEKLTNTFHEIPKRHPDLIAVVITGDGAKSFIGGADIGEMGSLESPAAARQFITRVHHACKSIRDCPVPVIGRVNGYALGAGLEVAASCDFRVASSNAVFGMPEVRIGVPSVVEAALLPGLIGWGRTRRFLLLGDNISATEALQWGLVEKVVEPKDLDEAVEGWIQRLEQNGPRAVRRQKALMRQWEQLGLDEGIKAGIPAFGQSFEAEGAEGMSEPSRLMKEFLTAKEKSKASSKL